jgi:hypothetical protein
MCAHNPQNHFLKILAIFFSTNREIVTDFLEVGIFQPERKTTPPDPRKHIL